MNKRKIEKLSKGELEDLKEGAIEDKEDRETEEIEEAYDEENEESEEDDESSEDSQNSDDEDSLGTVLFYLKVTEDLSKISEVFRVKFEVKLKPCKMAIKTSLKTETHRMKRTEEIQLEMFPSNGMIISDILGMIWMARKLLDQSNQRMK